MDKVNKFFDNIQKAEELFCVIVFVVMVSAAFLQVIIRYVLKASIPGPEEVSRLFSIMLTYMGCAIAVREGSQITIDALGHLVADKPKLKKISNVVIYVLGIIFAVVYSYLFYDYFVYAIKSKQVTIALGIPLAIGIGTMFISIALTLFHYVELLVGEISDKPLIN